jgi:transposase, IS5 family
LRRLTEVVTTNKTASDIWAVTAYRSKSYEPHPPQEADGKPMPQRTCKVNSVKSKQCVFVEHVFVQKAHIEPSIYIIGFKRTGAKIIHVNQALQ